MPKLFYNKQTDYIEKMNLVGDDLNLVTITNPGVSTTLDCSLSRAFYIALTNAVNCTITVNNVPAGFSYYSIYVYVQQTTSGSETITWTNGELATSPTSTMPTTANKITLFNVITFNGGSTWKIVRLATGWAP